MNPMVEPVYLDPKAEKIRLAGNVLVFGSGQLVHEQIFFDFNSASQVILYDPFPPPHENKVGRYFQSLDDALSQGPFNSVLCLFSLHYEPQWLFVLESLIKALVDGGEITFAEDRGFRCILDNGRVEESITSEPWYGFQKEASRVFFERAAHFGAPWYPDISASNYALVFEILSLFQTKVNGPRQHVFERKPAVEQEPGCYLPWNRVANPSLTDAHESATNLALAKWNVVKEVIEFTKFRKLRNLPDLRDLGNDAARGVWDIVIRRACENLGKIRVCPALQHAPEAREHFAKGFLQTAYLNLFRHFSSIGTAEIVIGFHSRLEKSELGKQRPNFAELPSCQFNTKPRKLEIKFDREGWLTAYMKSFDADQTKLYLAEQFDRIGAARLYLWPPPQLTHEEVLARVKKHVPSLVDISLDYAAGPELAGLREFCINSTPAAPLNLYILGSLAHQYSEAEPPETIEKIDAACVVYFVHNRYNYASHPDAAKHNGLLRDELQPLIYTLATIVQPLVGQSAYLELALKQQFYENALKKSGDEGTTDAALQEALYPECYTVEYQGEDYNPTVSIHLKNANSHHPVHHEKHKRLLYLIARLKEIAPFYLSKDGVCNVYHRDEQKDDTHAQTHVDEFRRYVRMNLCLDPDELIKNVSGQGWAAADGLKILCLDKNVSKVGSGKRTDWLVDKSSPEQENLAGHRARKSRRTGSDELEADGQ